jgi:uncharacterized protein YrzB (UPF0473 family)
MENKNGCNCGCGCNDSCEEHDHEHENMIYLETVDGENLACNVLGTFDVDEKEYIALLPEDSESVFIYQFKENDEELELIRIEDENEYKKISEIFLSMCELDEEEDEK